MEQTARKPPKSVPCSHDGKCVRAAILPATLDRAAALLRALGDPARLALVHHLAGGESCVGEIVAAFGGKFSTVSQRLKLLRAEGLVRRRRDGLHMRYSLADGHVEVLLANALAHAEESLPHPAGDAPASTPGGHEMSTHTHEGHSHKHGENCGHTAVVHEGHVDYLHDGHLHHVEGGKVEEHTLAVTAANPDACTAGHPCGGHDAAHVHGPGCGHEAVPHGDHTDYLVDGHLHYPHQGHCDNHGRVALA